MILYPNSMILKHPNPYSCANNIATEFEQELQSQLDIILKQNAKIKYEQNDNNNNDIIMDGFDNNQQQKPNLNDYKQTER